MKKLISLLLAVTMLLSLAACGGSNGTPDESGSAESGTPATGAPAETGSTGGDAAGSSETVTLTLWGAEEDQTYLAERVEAFKAAYPDYTFDVQIGVESESTAKDTILTDVTAAADVYAFASDQLPDLISAGALLDLTTVEEVLVNMAGKSIDDIIAANASASIDAASSNGTLYAFPFALDGFFMFYDPDYISAEQAATWDGLLEAAAAGGKQVGMTLASGWYNAAFFYGAGFTTGLNEDGTTTIDWNGTSSQGISGVDVVKAMQNIAGNAAFMAVADGDLSNQIASGKLCAVISGTWDTGTVEENFGDDYVACKLPTFDVNGTAIQTGSVASFKCIGVNPHAENTGWAVLLAEFLTNEESQIARYEAREIAPSNLAAVSSDAVAANKGIAGLSEQSEFGVVQTVGGKFWDPTATFGENIAQGKIASDDAAIQAALDQLVEGVTAPIA